MTGTALITRNTADHRDTSGPARAPDGPPSTQPHYGGHGCNARKHWDRADGSALRERQKKGDSVDKVSSGFLEKVRLGKQGEQ